MGEDITTSITFDAAIWPTLPREQRQSIISNAVMRQPGVCAQLMALVRAEPGFGVYASLGPNYQYAIFGRDSLEVAEDIIEVYPELARDILIVCAKLQGHRLESVSEEEVGKMHHEYRARKFGDTPISEVANHVFDHLSVQWGGNDQYMCYYGSIDTTPLFLRILYRYMVLYGPDILDETLVDYTDEEHTMRQHARLAAEWLRNYVSASEWDLLEFRRLNPVGLPNQAWKDSEVGYLHANGEQANADGGIASIEVQGYAYDALLAAATMVAIDDDEAEYFRQLAAQLQQQTLERIWMPEERFFAMGLDRDQSANTRQIRTLTSNSAAVLDSRLLLDLPDEVRQKYVEPIVHTIMGPDFLTEVGVRTRALRHVDLLSFADYHGSQVSWPKETYDIAKGLRRHGYEAEALDLETRILSAAQRSGEFYEFYYANREGKVKYHYRNEHPDEPQFHEFGVALLPEPGQAWTVSAALAIIAHTNGGQAR